MVSLLILGVGTPPTRPTTWTGPAAHGRRLCWGPGSDKFGEKVGYTKITFIRILSDCARTTICFGMPQTNDEKRAAWRAWYAANKEKQREYMRTYRAANPERFAAYEKKHNEKKKKRRQANPAARAAAARAERLKALYGLTPEQVTSMIEAQGFRCAACPRDVTDNPCVDHCHATGKVRGILCRKCNIALGHADDNPQTLRALADYLETSRSPQKPSDTFPKRS